MEGLVVGHRDEETRRVIFIHDNTGDFRAITLVGPDGHRFHELVIVGVASFSLAFVDSELVSVLIRNKDIACSIINLVNGNALVVSGESFWTEHVGKNGELFTSTFSIRVGMIFPDAASLILVIDVSKGIIDGDGLDFIETTVSTKLTDFFANHISIAIVLELVLPEISL